ncbi:MAG: hypothetical protein WCK53_08040 [Methanomicrobiales archaeon]
MGMMKRIQIEDHEREEEENKGKCSDCGERLTRAEKETDQDMCFDCYSHHQG